jgi:hypothetical protein
LFNGVVSTQKSIITGETTGYYATEIGPFGKSVSGPFNGDLYDLEEFYEQAKNWDSIEYTIGEEVYRGLGFGGQIGSSGDVTAKVGVGYYDKNFFTNNGVAAKKTFAVNVKEAFKTNFFEKWLQYENYLNKGYAPGVLGFNSSPRKCFLAGTIVFTERGFVVIEQIGIGESVFSFEPLAAYGRGALVPKKVVRTFTNITEEWLRLKWVENVRKKSSSRLRVISFWLHMAVSRKSRVWSQVAKVLLFLPTAPRRWLHPNALSIPLWIAQDDASQTRRSTLTVSSLTRRSASW